MKKISLVLALAAASTLMAADGAALAKKCYSCHGKTFEKKALNTSHVVKGWDAAKIEAALKGYRDGTYGRGMKGLMKGKVKSDLKNDDANIKAVSEYIAGLK